MLKLLNEKFNLKLSDENLEEYAARLGADCAFFPPNAPTYAEGIGNIFSPISLSLKGYQIVLVKPDIFVSTRDAFAANKASSTGNSIERSHKAAYRGMERTNGKRFRRKAYSPNSPAIKEIKEKLYQEGAIYAAMTGSGSSVFGLFKPEYNKSVKEDFGEKGLCIPRTLK